MNNLFKLHHIVQYIRIYILNVYIRWRWRWRRRTCACCWYQFFFRLFCSSFSFHMFQRNSISLFTSRRIFSNKLYGREFNAWINAREKCCFEHTSHWTNWEIKIYIAELKLCVKSSKNKICNCFVLKTYFSNDFIKSHCWRS